jgi:signal transduction histidine kinase
MRATDYMNAKASESRLRERNKELYLIVELSNFLAASLDMQAILDGALSQILEHFHLDAGRIYLRDQGEEFLTLAACKGMNPKGLERIKLTEGFSGKAARTGSFIARDVSQLEDKDRSDFLSGEGFAFVICVPLIVRDKVIGVMNLVSKTIIELDRDEVDLLIAAGNQIAIATNHAKIYVDLEKKEKTTEFFTCSVSHDLKNPAVGAYGLAQLLRKQYENVLDEKGKRYCEQIMKATAQIVDLVEDIKIYISAKESPLKLEKINFKEIAEVLRTEFAQTLSERGIRWIEPDKTQIVRADRVSIIRVLQNLVDNALKYGGKDMTEIGIQCKDNGESIILTVSDNGMSIEAEDLPRLFEAFQRGRTSRGTGGTGLGLAIVKDIAERHHGRAWVETGNGKGTAFNISIHKSI